MARTKRAELEDLKAQAQNEAGLRAAEEQRRQHELAGESEAPTGKLTREEEEQLERLKEELS